MQLCQDLFSTRLKGQGVQFITDVVKNIFELEFEGFNMMLVIKVAAYASYKVLGL